LVVSRSQLLTMTFLFAEPSGHYLVPRCSSTPRWLG
jgi:hypothetical protein